MISKKKVLTPEKLYIFFSVYVFIYLKKEECLEAIDSLLRPYICIIENFMSDFLGSSTPD